MMSRTWLSPFCGYFRKYWGMLLPQTSVWQTQFTAILRMSLLRGHVASLTTVSCTSSSSTRQRRPSISLFGDCQHQLHRWRMGEGWLWGICSCVKSVGRRAEHRGEWLWLWKELSLWFPVPCGALAIIPSSPLLCCNLSPALCLSPPLNKVEKVKPI